MYQGVLSRGLTYSTLVNHPKLLSLKLDALCRCYGVSSHEVNLHLVLVLARRCVPGFQIERRTSPPRRKWDDIRLAQLWIQFRKVREDFKTDKGALAHVAIQKDMRQITGNVKLVWIGQMLEKAKRSPLVQLMESSNKADRVFAKRFLNAHVHAWFKAV
jgi:hypothetical protein